MHTLTFPHFHVTSLPFFPPPPPPPPTSFVLFIPSSFKPMPILVPHIHTSRTKDMKSSWASVWLVGQAVKAQTKANCSHTAALGRARGPVGGPATKARARCKV